MEIKPKFINADDLVVELRDDLAQDCNRYMYWYQKEERDSKYIFAIDRIKEAPTADVAEVVHGQWIKDGESIYCSACGFETSSLLPYVCDGEKWVPCYANKYCGNCGARMDG